MFSWDEVQGLIRHALTTGGGVLVTHGVIGGGDVEPIVGALVALIGVVWSIVSKRVAK